ncbi:MAG: hypothetical protein AAB369_04490, partial [Chloroflexota bacterium]
MERGGGFDKEAFDNLLKLILEAKEKSEEPSEEKPAAAPDNQRADPLSPAHAGPGTREPSIIEPPAAPPSAAGTFRPEQPVDTSATSTPVQEAPASTDEDSSLAGGEQKRTPPEDAPLPQRLAAIEAAQERLLEQTQRGTQPREVGAPEMRTLPPKRALSPSPAEVPKLVTPLGAAATPSGAQQAPPTPAAEPPPVEAPATATTARKPEAPAAETAPSPAQEALDQPVADELAMVKVPRGGVLAAESHGMFDRLLALVRQLFPNFFPEADKSDYLRLGEAPDALYVGQVEFVISAEDSWGRLEKIMTGLATLPGANVRGLYNGRGGEHSLILELEIPAALGGNQAVITELKELS